MDIKLNIYGHKDIKLYKYGQNVNTKENMIISYNLHEAIFSRVTQSEKLKQLIKIQDYFLTSEVFQKTELNSLICEFEYIKTFIPEKEKEELNIIIEQLKDEALESIEIEGQFSEDILIHFHKVLNDDDITQEYEMSEIIYEKLMNIGYTNKLVHISRFDLYDDITFNKAQLKSLIEELNYVNTITNDKIIHITISQLIPFIGEIMNCQEDCSLVISGN